MNNVDSRFFVDTVLVEVVGRGGEVGAGVGARESVDVRPLIVLPPSLSPPSSRSSRFSVATPKIPPKILLGLQLPLTVVEAVISFDDFDGLNRADQFGVVVRVREGDERSVTRCVVDGRVVRTAGNDLATFSESWRGMTNRHRRFPATPTPSPPPQYSESPTPHSQRPVIRRSSWNSQTNNPIPHQPQSQESTGIQC